jgi:hypothetical protein
VRPDVIQQGKARAGETNTRKGESREVNERRGKAKGRQKQVRAGQTRTTRGQG